MEIKEGCSEDVATPTAPLSEEFDNMRAPERLREYLDFAKALFPQHAAVLDEKYGSFAEVDS